MQTQQSLITLKADEGRTVLVGGDLVTFKVSSHQTSGEYGLVEVTVPPLSGPPGLHVHPPQETFYVLEGEFEISGLGADGQPYAISATAGAMVHVPKGVPHNYKNVGATTGRLLVLFSPTSMEQFFAELGLPVADKTNPPALDGPPDMDRLMAICHKYQIEFLAPAEAAA